MRIEVNTLIKRLGDRYVGLSLIVLIIIALPVFYGGYAIHNDYYVYLYRGCCFPETNFLFLIGRPLGAILLNVEFGLLGGLEALRWARIFGFVLLFLIFLFTYIKFVSIQPERKFLAWLTALLISILPGFLLNTIWVADHVPGLVGTLTAIWAYYLCDTDDANGKNNTLGYAVLFLAFLIYPPSAYYFLVFTVWKSLFGDLQLRAIALDNLVLIIMSVAYLVFAKFINLPLSLPFSPDYAVHAATSSNYSLNLNDDILEKGKVLASLGQIAVGLWGADIFPKPWRFVILAILLAIPYKHLRRNPTPNDSATVATFTLILVIGYASVPVFNTAVALILSLILVIPLIKRAAFNKYWLGFAVLASVLISSAPIVASQTGFAVYRNTTSTAAITCVIFIWALAAFVERKILISISVCSLLIAGFLGHQRLEWTALNATSEYNFLKKKVDDYQPEDGTIVIKQPPYGSLIYPFYVYRDFGLFTTNVNPITGGLMTGLLQEKAASRLKSRRILNDSPISAIHMLIYPDSSFSSEQSAEELPIVWIYRDINGYEMDNSESYVIDMSLAGFPENKSDDTQSSAVISVKPVTMTPPIYAFDDDRQLFWNTNQLYWLTGPGFPVDLQIHFDRCKQIARYEISPWADEPSYMPREWVATFSNPRSTPMPISINHENLDRAGKVLYTLDKAGCYSQVNFLFSGGFSPDQTMHIGKIRFYE